MQPSETTHRSEVRKTQTQSQHPEQPPKHEGRCNIQTRTGHRFRRKDKCEYIYTYMRYAYVLYNEAKQYGLLGDSGPG